MKISLNETSPWHFVNGAWGASADGGFAPAAEVTSDDDLGLQGYRFAFCTRCALADFTASLVMIQRAHQDAGLIFRATDPEHFYVLHVPDIGQASRARNLWVALSEKRGDGFLRTLKMARIDRVASYPYAVPRRIKVEVRGDTVRARIDEFGVFEFSGLRHTKPGRVGLMSYRGSTIRDAQVWGEPVSPDTWDPTDRRRRHWFYPVQTERPCWQMPMDLLRVGSGELLLSFNMQHRPDAGEKSKATPMLSRSTANDRSWSAPEPLRVGGDQVNAWQPPRLHVTPGGRLIAIVQDTARDQFAVAESSDEARTWSSPAPANIPCSVAHVNKLVIGPQPPLNLADGSMLLFLYGGHDLKSPDLSIYSWGAQHCQAFATRSTDDGHTWSEPVQIDGLQDDPQTKPQDGNLDLTEPCAIQTGDGRIMALVRPIYSPVMWETWSTDGGQTWRACVPGPFPGYAVPKMLRTRRGVILVPHRLPGLTIHCSLDDGRTWDNGTMIDSGLWCMGSMIEVEPDIVLYVYWDSFETRMRAQFLKISESGIDSIAPENLGRS